MLLLSISVHNIRILKKLNDASIKLQINPTYPKGSGIVFETALDLLV
jgi:hypothetical protein